jgi:hypothetical protein
MFASVAIFTHLHTLSPSAAWLALTLFLCVMFESGLMDQWRPAVLIGLAALWDVLAMWAIGSFGLQLLRWAWAL